MKFHWFIDLVRSRVEELKYRPAARKYFEDV